MTRSSPDSDGDQEQWECPKCGKVMHHRKCKAHSKRDGKHCGDWAAQGSDVCRRHGASAGQVKAKAQRRLEEDKATKAVATYGGPVEVDPWGALLGELQRTAGHVAWLGVLVAGLEHGAEEDSESGQSRLRSGLRQFSGTKQGWEPSVWVDLYQEERKHLARVAKDCIAAGMEERRVRIEEDQAELLAQVCRGVVSELGHDPDEPEVRAVFRRQLTAVTADRAA